MIRPNTDLVDLHPPAALQVRSLVQVAPGRSVRMRGITGGRRLAARLAELGLYRGAPLEVLSGGGRGPVIVRSGGSRLALGRGMALKILVDDGRDVP